RVGKSVRRIEVKHATLESERFPPHIQARQRGEVRLSRMLREEIQMQRLMIFIRAREGVAANRVRELRGADHHHLRQEAKALENEVRDPLRQRSRGPPGTLQDDVPA